MDAETTYPRFLNGHIIRQRGVSDSVHEFPHICPGDGCAIAKWCIEKDQRTHPPSRRNMEHGRGR